MGRGRKKQEEIGEIVNSIRAIRNVIKCHSHELMRKFRITGPQLGVLTIIDRYPEISLSELSERMYLHISTVSGIVDRLETVGYLRRHRRPDDRRTLFFSLSEKGKGIMERSPKSAFGMMMKGLDRLPDSELYQISRSLKILVNMMGIKPSLRNKLYNHMLEDDEAELSMMA